MRFKSQYVANAIFSFGLFFMGAQANEAEPSQTEPPWMDLKLDVTSQPVKELLRELSQLLVVR